jgi:hypothetical protein
VSRSLSLNLRENPPERLLNSAHPLPPVNRDDQAAQAQSQRPQQFIIIHPVQFLTGDHLVHRREADLPRDVLRRARISPQRALHESRMGGG